MQLNSLGISQRLRKLILTRSLLKPNSRKLISAKFMVKPKWRTITTAKCLKKNSRKLVPVNISCNSSSAIVILRHLIDLKKTMRQDMWNHKNCTITCPWKIFQIPLNINTISSTTRQMANK